MKEQFLSFELSKKLKAKGFECKYPFAMYDKYGQFCPLFTSADEYVDGTGFRQRDVYNFDDFDEKDVIAPAIDQALTWLRKEKKLHVEFVACAYGYNYIVSKTPPDGTDLYFSHTNNEGPNDGGAWDDYEPAAIAAIKYITDYFL